MRRLSLATKWRDVIAEIRSPFEQDRCQVRKRAAHSAICPYDFAFSGGDRIDSRRPYFLEYPLPAPHPSDGLITLRTDEGDEGALQDWPGGM